MSAEYAGRARIVKVDADANPRTISTYGIRAMPTLTMFHNGVVVSQVIGAQPRFGLRAQIDAAIAPHPDPTHTFGH